MRMLDEYFNKLGETMDCQRLVPRDFKQIMMLGADLPTVEMGAVPLINHVLSLKAVRVKNGSIITMCIYHEGDLEVFIISFQEDRPSSSAGYAVRFNSSARYLKSKLQA